MPCSSQPNGESARAPTRIFVWRQSLRVGVRADGADPYGKSEPLRALVAGHAADEFLPFLHAEYADGCAEAGAMSMSYDKGPRGAMPRWPSASENRIGARGPFG